MGSFLDSLDGAFERDDLFSSLSHCGGRVVFDRNLFQRSLGIMACGDWIGFDMDGNIGFPRNSSGSGLVSRLEPGLFLDSMAIGFLLLGPGSKGFQKS